LTIFKKRDFILFAAIIILLLTNSYSIIKALEYRNHINDYLYKYVHLLEELSQIKVYEKANRQITLKNPGKKRVIFFGTQVTAKWPLEKYFHSVEVINRGIVGQRFEGLMLRFRNDVIKLNPDVMVLEIASFHVRPFYKMNLMKDYIQNMVELSQIHGIVPVLTTVITPVPFKKEFSYQEVVDSIHALNQWLKNYAQKKLILFCDFDSILKSQSGYISIDMAMNNVEPNETGYALISRELEKLISGYYHKSETHEKQK
jgi:hypothetical protein